MSDTPVTHTTQALILMGVLVVTSTQSTKQREVALLINTKGRHTKVILDSNFSLRHISWGWYGMRDSGELPAFQGNQETNFSHNLQKLVVLLTVLTLSQNQNIQGGKKNNNTHTTHTTYDAFSCTPFT
jgi:hypothetical protein